MNAVTWQGKRDVRVEELPDPRIEYPDGWHREDHLVGDLRLRPASVRGARSVHEAWRHPGPRTDGHRAGTRCGGHQPGRGGSGCRAVQHLLRALLHVHRRPAIAVRDDPGAEAEQGRRAVRVLLDVRLGPWRSAEYLRV